MRARQPSELPPHGGRHRRGIGTDLLNDRGNDALALFDQRHEEVLGQNLRMPFAVGELLRAEDRFLSFFCVFVDVHDLLSPSTPNFQLPTSKAKHSKRLTLVVGGWELGVEI